MYCGGCGSICDGKLGSALGVETRAYGLCCVKGSSEAVDSGVAVCTSTEYGAKSVAARAHGTRGGPPYVGAAAALLTNSGST